MAHKIMIKYFNVKAIEELKRNTQVAPAGFRYGYAKGIINKDIYEELIATFPDVSKFQFIDKQSGGGRKSFYVGPNYYSGKNWGSVRHMDVLPNIWQKVLRESADPALVDLLQDATGIKMNSLCNFGFTYGREGSVQEPHIDGAARPNDPAPVHASITFLMYFNKEHGGSSGTVIYAPDRKTALFQVPDLRDSISFFEQHQAAWHGFPMVPKGEDRRLVSLSYSQEKKPTKISSSLFSYIGARIKAKWKGTSFHY